VYIFYFLLLLIKLFHYRLENSQMWVDNINDANTGLMAIDNRIPLSTHTEFAKPQKI